MAAEGKIKVLFVCFFKDSLKITFVLLGNYGNGTSGSEGTAARDKSIRKLAL